MKHPVEVQLPSSNRFLVIFCVEKSGDYIPPALFDDLPLNLGHGPAIEIMVSERLKMHIAGDLIYDVS